MTEKKNLQKTEPFKFPGLKSLPQDPQEQATLGDELIDWVNNKPVLDLDLFPLSKGYNPQKFFQMNNEYFQEALAFAKGMLCVRLEEVYAKADLKNYLLKKIAILDADWRDAESDNKKDKPKVLYVIDHADYRSDESNKQSAP